MKNDSSISDLQRMLERMAAWQRSRRSLSWAEKVRMAEAVRESLAEYRRARAGGPGAVSKKPEAGN